MLAGVSPDAKVAEVVRLQEAGQRVAMVGDGVNDAAALVQADLGIAMGTGVGAAIEAADISVVSGDLRGVARALRLARETYAIVLQNLGWAFGYNLIALPLAITGPAQPDPRGRGDGRLERHRRRQQPAPAELRASRDGRRPCARARQRLAEPRRRRRSRPPRSSARSSSPTPTPSSARPKRPARSPSRTARSLDVNALPLQPGNVAVHTYLVGATRGQPTLRSIAMTRDLRARVPGARSASSAPARPTSSARSASPAGNGRFRISGADGAHHALGGSFTIPIS